MFGKCIFILLVFCALTLVTIEGKRVLLRPISASEVRRILKSAGREDAVPEGRVISQGIAAVKGFALGFKKGVLGVAIVDGLAALSSSSSSSSNSSSSSSSKPSFSYNGTSNELCFTSRSATSDIVATGDGDGDERKILPTVTTGTATTATTPTTATTGTGSPSTTNVVTNTNTGTGTGTNTATKTATTTQTGSGGTVNCIVINKG